MSREARMFTLLRSWVDDAYWRGTGRPAYVMAMHDRLRMEAGCLIQFMAS